jgi:carbon-monoxide dehydrogenase medium subunit
VQDFFVDWYKTALQPGDMVKAIHVPKADPNAVGYHEKYARVEGDFATVSAHVILSMNGETCNYIRIAIGACGPVPVRLVEAEKLLAGKSLTKDLILQAGRMLSEACDPVDDVRGSATYRLKLIPQLLLTAVEKAQRQLAQRSPA